MESRHLRRRRLPHDPASGVKPDLFIDPTRLAKGVEPVPAEMPKDNTPPTSSLTPHASFKQRTDSRWSAVVAVSAPSQGRATNLCEQQTLRGSPLSLE